MFRPTRHLLAATALLALAGCGSSEDSPAEASDNAAASEPSLIDEEVLAAAQTGVEDADYFIASLAAAGYPGVQLAPAELATRLAGTVVQVGDEYRSVQEVPFSSCMLVLVWDGDTFALSHAMAGGDSVKPLESGGVNPDPVSALELINASEPDFC